MQRMINLNERASAQLLAPPLSPQPAGGDGTPGTPRMTGLLGSDGIANMLRPAGTQQDPSLFQYLPLNGMGGIMQMFMNVIAQLLSSFGLFAQQPNQQQTSYSNATASSLGDPHLSFNGSDASGNTHSAKYDSMAAHADFLDSDSFAGGYRVSTDVTAPNANGVTWNRSATVTTNYGGTEVSLSKEGNASVTQNGRTFAIADGETLSLGNGETVARAADGSLTITDNDGRGGSIATTLASNGRGVDVNVRAQNVDLGGDVVR